MSYERQDLLQRINLDGYPNPYAIYPERGRFAMRKNLLLFLLLALTFFPQVAWGKKNLEKEENVVIKMGSGGVYADMVEIIKEQMAEKAITVELVNFDSNSGPADACSVGDIDCFIFNHTPWLEQYNAKKGTSLKVLMPVYYGRAAMYSRKYKKIDELPDGATIAIPNDAVNMDNTMKFFQRIGLITLGKTDEKFYTIMDIIQNPKKIRFVETEITYTARSINSCDAVVCTALLAREAGMDAEVFLAEDEGKKDFPIGLTVKANDAGTNWAKAMLEVLKSDVFKEKFNKRYQGTLVLY